MLEHSLISDIEKYIEEHLTQSYTYKILHQPPAENPSAEAAPAPARSAFKRYNIPDTDEQNPFNDIFEIFCETAEKAPPRTAYSAPADITKKIESYININLQDSFSCALFKLIDASGETDSAVYSRACVDRRTFSKIRSDPAYRPAKATAVSLALALHLNGENCNNLLWTAGYSLGKSSKFDLIITYCADNGIFDIGEVNELLYHFGCRTLDEKKGV